MPDLTLPARAERGLPGNLVGSTPNSAARARSQAQRRPFFVRSPAEQASE